MEIKVEVTVKINVPEAYKDKMTSDVLTHLILDNIGESLTENMSSWVESVTLTSEGNHGRYIQ